MISNINQILVYGDSLSWGIVPNTRQRLSFYQRWPGVLEQVLGSMEKPVRVFENCLNGRRTVWDDPFKPGRNGLQGIGQVMEMHAPLALAIVMLGSNDFQSMHPNNAWHSAQGLAAVVTAMRAAPIEPGMPVCPILVIAPPLTGEASGEIAGKFTGAAVKAAGMVAEYRDVTKALGCHFFDANRVISASSADGVHLDPEAHIALGQTVAKVVAEILF